MPCGYLIANIRVHDWDKWPEYSQRAGPYVRRCGGRYLVTNNDTEHREGNLPIARLVIIEFPSLEAAKAAFDSEEYRNEIMPYRLRASDSDVFFVEGRD